MNGSERESQLSGQEIRHSNAAEQTQEAQGSKSHHRESYASEAEGQVLERTILSEALIELQPA